MAKTIVLIEDNTDLQTIYSRALSNIGYNVIVSENGMKGLQEIKDNSPDLILLDIMLPGKWSGFDVLENLKRDNDLKDIPVIVMTNLDTERKTAMEIGVTDYIVKNKSTMEQVISKIEENT